VFKAFGPVGKVRTVEFVFARKKQPVLSLPDPFECSHILQSPRVDRLGDICPELPVTEGGLEIEVFSRLKQGFGESCGGFSLVAETASKARFEGPVLEMMAFESEHARAREIVSVCGVELEPAEFEVGQ